MKKLILKVIRNLIKPHKIPKKIFSKFEYYFNHKKYNQDLFEKEQNNIFNYFGLNRKDGVNELILVKKNLHLNLYTNLGMSSEHEVIFSSLSLDKKKSITEILEIGTFDGFNALLLSNLFPNSNIDTIDLPEKDNDFINFYNRQNKIDEFIKNRNILLSKNKNINFLPINSLKLLNNKKRYDLIWIDGAHGYPVVCIDIINSLYMIKENGLILCDDVNLNLNQINSDKMYNSIASYETLNELKKQNLVDFKLVYKRLDARFNCLEEKRKFIAIVKKTWWFITKETFLIREKKVYLNTSIYFGNFADFLTLNLMY